MIGLLAVASAVVLIRALVFIHREAMGVRPTYPGTWSAAQCRNLAHFRLLVGLGTRRQHLRFDVRLQHPERALRASLASEAHPLARAGFRRQPLVNFVYDSNIHYA